MNSSNTETIEQLQAEIVKITAKKNQCVKDGEYEASSDLRLQEKELLAKIENHIKRLNDPMMAKTVYLLCSPEGIEWQPDPLRENPDDRDRLFNIYEKNLNFYKQNYFILRGGKQQRFTEAVKIIKRLLKNE